MHFLKLIRFFNLIILGASLSLFYYFIIDANHHNILNTKLVLFSPVDFALFVLSVLLVAAAGNVINDYYDYELDKKFKPNRPLPSGAFSLDQALYLHAVFAFTGIALGFYLGYSYSYTKAGYFYVIAVLLLYIYSAYLKKIPLIGNIVVSGLTAFVFVLLQLFELNFLQLINFEFAPRMINVLNAAVLFYGGFAFLTNLAREIIKDLEDMKGDEDFGINTLPVSMGENAAKLLTAVVLITLALATAYYLKGFYFSYAHKEFYYLLITVFTPVLLTLYLLFSATEEKDYKKISIILKGIMLAGILSIPLFHYFNL